MNIQRCENELILSERFQKDLLNCNSLVPGIAKKSKDLLSNKDYSFMCATGMKKDIENLFGKSNCFVEGKGKKSTFFAFIFKNETIVCTCESGGIGLIHRKKALGTGIICFYPVIMKLKTFGLIFVMI